MTQTNFIRGIRAKVNRKLLFERCKITTVRNISGTICYFDVYIESVSYTILKDIIKALKPYFYWISARNNKITLECEMP